MFGDERMTPPTPTPVHRRRRDDEGFRRFLERGLWPLMTLLAGGLYTSIQHGRVEDKVSKVSEESTEVTKAAYQGLANPAKDMRAALKAALARIDSLEKTQAAQSALIIANNKDFVIEGRPAAPAKRRRVDAALVQAVRENAVKDAKELAARAKHPAPVIAPIPLEPPAPQPATAPKPPAPPVVVPTGTHDAAPAASVRGGQGGS